MYLFSNMLIINIIMIFSFIFTIFAALSYCLTLIGLFLININYSGGGVFLKLKTTFVRNTAMNQVG